MGYRINDRNYTIADIFKEYFLDKYADFSTRTPRKQFLITSAFIYATIFITAVVDVFADTWSDELSIGIFSAESGARALFLEFIFWRCFVLYLHSSLEDIVI